MVQGLLNKVIGYLDFMFAFVNKYSNLFIWGVVAMMVAKLAKFNVKIGK